MAQAAGLGLLTTDRALLVRSWNGWLASATGIDAAHAQGQPLLELVPADRRQLYREVCAEVLDRGTSRVLAPAFHHYLFPCAPISDSSHFTHMQQRVTVAPLTQDGAVVGVIATVEDMTAALDEQRDLAARVEQGERPSRDALRAIGAPDWRVRGAAVRALQGVVSQDDVASLIATIERDHQNLDVLSSALRVLIAAGRDVVSPLVALLSSPHANLRMHAALALGELGEAEAVLPLVAALDDSDANVRFHAIEALGRIAAPAAVEPLTRIAESADFFLSFPAIDALARTDDPRVVPSLLVMLDNDLLRPAVIDTLAALGDEDCVEPLAGLLNARSTEAAPVAAALVRIRDSYQQSFAAGEHIVEIARAAMTRTGIAHLAEAIHRRDTPTVPLAIVIGWMGPDALDSLVSLVGDPALQPHVEPGLLRLGPAAAAPLLGLLGSDARAARIGAVSLLGRLGDRQAVPALIGLLAEADTDLVTASAAALSVLGDPRALDGLLPLFASEHPAVRQAAIAAVNAIGTGRIEPLAVGRLRDPNPHVRECAIRVAGYFGFPSCVGGIVDCLDDDHEEVRRAAIEQLPLLAHAQAAERLARALQRETPRNRAAAAHAARAAGEAAIVGPLIAALDDTDPWVRYFAAGSLGEFPTADAAAVLTRAATRDPAAPVRIAAIQALGGIDPDAAVTVAAGLLGSADDDVSCAAVVAIARAAGTDADRLLERTVRAASPVLQRCAIEALAARQTSIAVETLAWAARLTDSPAVGAAAVEALGSIAAAHGEAGTSAVGALLDIGADTARRAEVVDALSRVSGDGIEVVARRLSDPRPAARVTAVEALARMRQPLASRALAGALHDGDATVRGAAVAAFGRLGTPAAGPMIAGLRETDPDPVVRRKALIVCDRYGWQR